MTHYLANYTKFKTKEEMDAAARKQLDLHWNQLNKTDRAVVEMIRCYSVKYLAAHLKHETIEAKLKVSNSTVRRSLRKLEKLQIIERIGFNRPVTSGRGANIYILLPADDQAGMNSGNTRKEACRDAVEEPKIENEPSFYKSKNLKDLKKTSHPAAEELSTTLFGRMKSLLANTGDISQARQFYGIHQGLSSQLLKFEIHKGKEKLFEDLSYRATHITVMAMKKKTIQNLPAYFNGVLRELINEALFSDLYQEFTVSVDDFYWPGKAEAVVGY